MKLYKGLIYSFGVAALLTGCAKEDPFASPEYDGPTGTLMTRCLAPTIGNPDGIEAATRAAVPSTDDFKVVIARKTAASAVSTYAETPGSVEYNYSEMPEVLTLPADDYKAYAYYGDNKPAAWDEPYYYGESEFGIEANKITDDVDPIVAKLANIRVTIVFHPTLLSAMSGNDNKVEVKMGGQGTGMTFVPTETRSAYFKYVDQSQTIAATFSGMVDGAQVVQTKTHDNVKPGNHYRITFKLHGIDDENPGTISTGVTIDASVEKVDMNHTIDGEPEEILDDDWRPTQGGDEPTPPGPGPNDPEKSGPKAEALTPGEGQVGINLDTDNEITDNLYCAWKVTSEAESGFQEFTVDIISNRLTPETLKSVGLTDHLDLINPGVFKEKLQGLGFPVEIGGQTLAEFSISSQFLGLMKNLGAGNHEFKMTIKDSNGTSIVSLKLHNN